MIGIPSDQFDIEPVDVQCTRDVKVMSLAKQMAGLKLSPFRDTRSWRILPTWSSLVTWWVIRRKFVVADWTHRDGVRAGVQ